MFKTVYHIKKMDCPSEESIIRMKLEDLKDIKNLEFDLNNRLLTVYHVKENPEIEKRIKSLNFGCDLKESSEIDPINFKAEDSQQRQLLWWVLAINFAFFLIEITTGLISKSMGLVADSLDMLADAVVYGLSLWAVGGALGRKRKVAKISGLLQIILALLGFNEVIRRFISADYMPNYKTMIMISFLALIANAVSMIILNKSKSNDAHIQASKIFTSNDIIINIGVILAGFLVMLTQSFIPDLIIGAIIFLIVVRGAIRILKLK